jgi:hypothetical protein
MRVSHEGGGEHKEKWETGLSGTLPELSRAMSIQLHKANQLSLGTRTNVNQTLEPGVRFAPA